MPLVPVANCNYCPCTSWFYLEDSNEEPKTFHLDWLQIEVSSLCNGACAYCAQRSYRSRWRGGLMDWRTFERLEPDFANTDLVFLQGWGEPLLHPAIWQMVRRVTAAGAAVGFTTNGTLLEGESQVRLVEDGVSVVGVSLAGTTATTHERFRPTCNFQAIDQSLQALAQLKRRKGSEYPRVHLAFLLLRSNLEEVGGLVDLASRWGASQIVVSNLSWIVKQEMEDECTLLDPAIWPRAAEVLEQARSKASSKGMLLRFYGPGVGEPRSICPENVLRACFVSHSGNVSPCVYTNVDLRASNHVSHYFDGQRREMEPIVFGNVHEQSLPEIWNSQKARQFRNTFEDRLRQEHPGTSGLPAACTRCYRLREVGWHPSQQIGHGAYSPCGANPMEQECTATPVLRGHSEKTLETHSAPRAGDFGRNHRHRRH